MLSFCPFPYLIEMLSFCTGFVNSHAEGEDAAGAADQGDGPELAQAVTNATLVRDVQKEEIEQQQTEALRVLGDRIAAEREAKMDLLHAKYDRSQGIAWYVAELLAQGVRSICELETNAETPEYLAVIEELQNERAEEERALEALLQQEESYQTQVIHQTTESALMILQHERNLESLKSALESARSAQQAALRERLAKRRGERANELLEQGSGEVEAAAQAQQECAAEEEECLAVINKEFEQKLQSLTEKQLGDIKNR